MTETPPPDSTLRTRYGISDSLTATALYEKLASGLSPELAATATTFFICRSFLDRALAHYRASGANQESEFRLAALEAELLTLGSKLEEQNDTPVQLASEVLSSFLNNLPFLPRELRTGAEELLAAAALLQPFRRATVESGAANLGLITA